MILYADKGVPQGAILELAMFIVILFTTATFVNVYLLHIMRIYIGYTLK